MPKLSLVVWAVCATLTSADTPYDRGRFTLHVANDDFGSGHDEAFTSGLEARIRITPGDNVALSGLHPELLRLRLHEYWGLSLGQHIYTPALIQVTDVDLLRDDRRYAGWLYGALSVELGLDHSPFLSHGHSLYAVELSIGATGPQTQTEPLQRYWHAFIRDALNRRNEPFDPKGWGVYQVPNYWGINLRLYQESEFFRWDMSMPRWRRAVGASLGLRMASKAQVRIGNMWIDGTGGFIVRGGLMPPIVFDDWSSPQRYEGKMVGVPLAIYGFVSGHLTGSIYNALLDGPPGAEGPYPDRTYFLARIEAGFVIRLAALAFTFRHTTLSPELRNRPSSGVWIQNWGTISLSFVIY